MDFFGTNCNGITNGHKKNTQTRANFFLAQTVDSCMLNTVGMMNMNKVDYLLYKYKCVLINTKMNI